MPMAVIGSKAHGLHITWPFDSHMDSASVIVNNDMIISSTAAASRYGKLKFPGRTNQQLLVLRILRCCDGARWILAPRNGQDFVQVMPPLSHGFRLLRSAVETNR